MSQMNLFLLSVTHRTAPLELRERLAFDHAARDALVDDLKVAAGEVVPIITCNRTEVYVVADAEECASGAIALLARHAGLEPVDLVPFTVCLEGEAAARHLFRVAAGLDSIVVGEPQILGQVRDAAEAARVAGSIGPVLSRLFNMAVVAGKRARSETPISRGAGSVSHAAVELAREILGDLRGRSAVVVGLGDMGQLVARNLAAHGVSDLAVCNRTPARAEMAARELGGRAVPWESLDDALARSDIAITATSARDPILTRDRMERIVGRRGDQPLLLIDIAVPRDVDPAVADVAGIHLRDIDALHDIRSVNLRTREEAVPKVEAIIDEQVAAFASWCRGRKALPVIRGLREQVEAIRAAEVERAMRRLGHLSERDREIVLALSHGIANKVLHRPVTRLKQAAEQDGYARAIADLFDLDIS